MEIEAAKILAEAITGAVYSLQLSILGCVIVYIAVNLRKAFGHD